MALQNTKPNIVNIIHDFYYQINDQKVLMKITLALDFDIVSTVTCFSRIHEPRHDKINKMSVRPAKTLISLGIRPV